MKMKAHYAETKNCKFVVCGFENLKQVGKKLRPGNGAPKRCPHCKKPVLKSSMK